MQEAGEGVVSLVSRPGGHGLAFETMLEVVIYVSSTPLAMCSALMQLGSCQVNIVL